MKARFLTILAHSIFGFISPPHTNNDDFLSESHRNDH